MKYSSIPSAQSVVLHCKAKGFKNVVISPGSRNAPLIIGFTEDSSFNCFSVVDERCAAFFALGMAQQTRKPVVLVCTSGSALLNYYPAIAEAFYSTIPMLILSADRPSYKIDIGDGQTIRQENVFQNHILSSLSLKQDVSHATERVLKYAPNFIDGENIEKTQEQIQSHNDKILNQGLNAVLQKMGPVHINIPFEEPLYNTLSMQSIIPQIKHEPSLDSTSSFSDLEELRNIWVNTSRKMVLVGVNQANSIDQMVLDSLCQDPSVLVLTETTSNLHHPDLFPSIDMIIAPLEKLQDQKGYFDALRPELLLTFGGLIVSKKIKAFLRNFKPDRHWHIDRLRAYDTFFALSRHIKMNPNIFLQALLSRQNGPTYKGAYKSYWEDIKQKTLRGREEYVKRIPFSDLLAFYFISMGVPDNYQLHLGNSSTVRYAQLFSWSPRIHVYCNRGTSGIDGSTSTAVGASIHYRNPTLLITGDLSFFYDSNALWNNAIRPDFRIILINNGGGGIFRILPGKIDDPNFETFFETVQELEVQPLCKMFGLHYSVADNSKDLKDMLESFYDTSKKPKLLEIRTSRLLNNKILLDYFDFLSSRLH
ncbi:MAG: 2-succinyl-5-enolpyruvyl-6-hydroxy-3-cyclohexene-1-carboxylic-acid synthase [Bacteroidota bacterium]